MRTRASIDAASFCNRPTARWTRFDSSGCERSTLTRIAQADAVDAARIEPLVALLNSVAHSQRETMAARRAGDKIKKDIVGTREPGKRPEDERDSVAPLTTSTALDALLGFDAGPFGAEARSIALLCAMDRMQTAKDLPKHLKVYAQTPHRR
jgi:hypothetical protein